MKTYIKVLLCLFLSCFLKNIYAQKASSTAPTTPTPSSQPLPSLNTSDIDTVLSEKAQSIISKLPILKNQAVTAASYQQIITLQGSVETKEQEAAAIKAAMSVRGVKKVKSDLTIKALKAS